jgi:hypothetical protein
MTEIVCLSPPMMLGEPDLNSSEKGFEVNKDTELSVAVVTVEEPPVEDVDGGLKAWSTLIGA